MSYLMFMFGQAIVWVQTNGPIIWPWARQYKFPLMLLGVPVTWLFMEATSLVVQGFNGEFWPGRFMSFTAGIIIFRECKGRYHYFARKELQVSSLFC